MAFSDDTFQYAGQGLSHLVNNQGMLGGMRLRYDDIAIDMLARTVTLSVPGVGPGICRTWNEKVPSLLSGLKTYGYTDKESGDFFHVGSAAEEEIFAWRFQSDAFILLVGALAQIGENRERFAVNSTAFEGFITRGLDFGEEDGPSL